MSLRAQAFQRSCRSRLLVSASPSIPLHPAFQFSRRNYATQGDLGGSSSAGKNTASYRKAITVTSDDGRYNWSELSTREKAARTTQQSVNFVIVAAGAVGTLIVAYFLYTELFAADSKTRQFNHAVDRVRSDSQCIGLLGRPASKIKAYGEPTTNKWARARPLAHNVEVDKFGTTHFRMHFHVEGTENQGVVNVHMTKTRDQSQLEYQLLSLNVKGHPVINLENKSEDLGIKGKAGKLFGVQWR